MSETEQNADVGCAKCNEPESVWTKPYLTTDGVFVWVCDECGRARVETQSQTKDVEMWLVEVRRDEKGRFVSTGDDDE